MEINRDKRIVFTQHARDRFAECRFRNVGEVIRSFMDSVPDNSIKKYKDMMKDKKEKYRKDQASYRRNGTVIFTYTEKTDKFTKEDIYLIITVTNQLASSGIKI